MSNIQIILIVVFFVSSIVGYFVIRNIPSLLHTPLMSGMNALSGITLIGALIAFAVAFKDYPPLASIAGGLAIVVATANVVGGISITDRMLKLFKKEGKQHDK